MSTKIYDGKVMKAKYIAEFHAWFYGHCVSEIRKLILKAHGDGNPNKINRYIETRLASVEKNHGKEVAEKLRNGLYFQYDFALLKMVVAADGGGVWLNPSCGYCIYPDGNDVLLRVFVPGSNHANEIKFPKYVKDYCYWDNVDPLKTISQEEWDNRGKRWDKVFDLYKSPLGCDIFKFSRDGITNWGCIETLEAAQAMIVGYDKNHGMMYGSVYKACDKLRNYLDEHEGKRPKLDDDSLLEILMPDL